MRENLPSDDRPHTGRDVKRGQWLASSLLLIALVFLAFAPLRQNDFVGWDDPHNILNNEAIRGFSAENLAWMFTATHGGHYHPLTWLSWAVDYSLWNGLKPAGFHLTNEWLHAVAAVLLMMVAIRLFAVVNRTGSTGVAVSAFVAAVLFAVHPLRVESVAWATERRDVLSGALLMAALLGWLKYVGTGDSGGGRRRWYAVALIAYLLSLLSKAVGVSFPVVLLILDWCPLRRWGKNAGAGSRRSFRSLLVEKIPFLIPAIAAAVMAGYAQRTSGAMRTLTEHPIGLRIAQAFYGLFFYVQKSLWPTELSPLYEQDPRATPWESPFVVSALLVLGLAALIWVWRRRLPALAAAGLAYVVLVFPMLGLAQSGPQVVADRYSYLSCMPWALLVGGGVLMLWRRSKATVRAAILVCFAGIVMVLTVETRAQVRIWKNSRTLWETVVARGTAPGLGHANLAVTLNNEGEYAAACEHATMALETLPGNRSAHAALGYCSLALRNYQRAETHLVEALEIASAIDRRDVNSLLRLTVVKFALHKDVEGEHLLAELRAQTSDAALTFLAEQLRTHGRADAAERVERIVKTG